MNNILITDKASYIEKLPKTESVIIYYLIYYNYSQI